jgi:hypothetical protein
MNIDAYIREVITQREAFLMNFLYGGDERGRSRTEYGRINVIRRLGVSCHVDHSD